MDQARPIAEVIVDLHSPDVDRVFHYLVPASMQAKLQIGHRVIVPFGHRERVEGYVIGLLDSSPFERLRPISAIVDPDPLLSPTQIQLARWMKDYYLCPLVQALQCFLPPGSRLRSGVKARPKQKRYVRLANPETAHHEAIQLSRRAPKQAAILSALADFGGAAPVEQVLTRASATHASLKTLIDRGMVVEEYRTVRRDPFEENKTVRRSVQLTKSQEIALAKILHSLKQRSHQTLLLQGVTGSGKTEVYMRAISEVVQQGRGAIVLVPEISLTPQTIASFRGVFGDRVALLHSKLSIGERYDEWQRIFHGEAQVVVGARSAVFAPVQNLGLIILDEEHESSYKQDEAPRYHARSVAEKRVEMEGATLVLGTATPDLTSRYRAQAEGTLLVLPERVEARPMPDSHVVDMREELAAGNRSIFSRELTMRLSEKFRQGEQVILFMNRRGYASFLLCRECGEVPRCDMCEVSYTFHLPESLRCHYCDATRLIPKSCPTCGSLYLRPFGGGTQKIEEELRRLFPHVRSLRMDVDTTTRKGAHARMIAAFAAKEYDCLIGTQMIAKGLHFPGVTLVGVVSADTGLFFPDFRAAERTFQLLTQVAGRAGRGDLPGDVVIQTYAPDHYAIQAAAEHDYERFYREEMAYRQRVGYPPFGQMVRCLWSGESEDEVIKEADKWGRYAHHIAKGTSLVVLGPRPAPLSRIKGRYRFHLVLKGEDNAVRTVAKSLKEEYDQMGLSSVRLVVDVDPVQFL